MKDLMLDLSIGIVTYNRKSLLEQCLYSIAEVNPAIKYEIIVVDNASSDETVEWLRQAYPQVRVIANSENRLIAVGNNQCIQLALGRYVLLLNNDTIILPDMLEKLVSFADQHPQAAAVGGKLINQDGSFQASFADFPDLWIEFLHATRAWQLFDRHYPTHGDVPELRQVDWICSACLLVRKSAVEQVGGVDEAFIMYSDETELQYRLHQAGWQVYYLPEVVTIHLGGASASHWRRRRMIYRGKLLFFQKHRGALKTFILRLIFGGAGLAKLPFWVLALLSPTHRQRAINELRSNWEVILLSASRIP